MAMGTSSEGQSISKGTSGVGGLGESLTINIDITSSFDNTGTEEAKKETLTLGRTTKSVWGQSKEDAEEYSNELRNQISPIRSVSWDLMLMGRSISILNTNLLGNNQQVKEFLGYVYAISAAMRIATTAVDMYRTAIVISSMVSAAKTTVNLAEAASTMKVAGAYATLQTVAGNPAAMGLLAAGAAGASAVSASYMSLPSYQKGGTIPATGAYLLHKNETVVPAGGSNFNVVNINMTTGAISSNIGVDNMLDAMAKRMLVEKRRRGVS
jgi:hypothetical protein